MENYSKISMVGKGSFGRVYMASEISTGSIVALKIIVKKGRTKKEIKNLRGECEIQKHLMHPNIIRMLNSFETNNEIVVVTEYAQSDLHKLLAREGSIDERRVQRLTFDLVSALYYLHSHRILHRDLKPQNILLDRDERAKLCDFGLARNMTMETHVLTSIKGTPLYMAPEIINEKPYDHQADLWSLGCILYETLAGEPPFSTNSIIRLALLIRDENIQWPSFLTEMCVSFLKGLLEKEPTARMTWTEILCHPFVKENIFILNEDIQDSPFTHQMSKSESIQKQKQTDNLLQMGFGGAISKRQIMLPSQQQQQNAKISLDKAPASSQDSIHAIIQSDFENIETDNDEMSVIKSLTSLAINENISGIKVPQQIHTTIGAIPNAYNETCFVSGNQNLIVNHLNDNFQCQSDTVDDNVQQSKTLTARNKVNKLVHKNRELEKRKLSQNLDNFSVRLGKSMTAKDNDAPKTIVVDGDDRKTIDNSINKQAAYIKDKSPPSMLPGWDSCDEYQSPPIENEEWLAFLYRSMQEILDGEIDSLKQQNLVSIIVAPLRNVKASSKVIDCVAKLLSLPLIIDCSSKDLADIRNVYIEVKLVPNLVYASKLLCGTKSSVNNESQTPTETTYKKIQKLTNEELTTLRSLYELVCHLVHLNDQFLSQFCDAVAILGANELLINFISNVPDDRNGLRLANSILALLCYSLRELPENAELVEKIIFNSKVNIVNLMKNNDGLIKSRMCMLLRMAGRFSCYALQNVWTIDMKETLEALAYDSNERVRNEAEEVLEEFKHLSFYVT